MGVSKRAMHWNSAFTAEKPQEMTGKEPLSAVLRIQEEMGSGFPGVQGSRRGANLKP